SVLFIASIFVSSRSRHTSSKRDWSSDVCSSDLIIGKKSGNSSDSVSKSESEKICLSCTKAAPRSLESLKTLYVRFKVVTPRSEEHTSELQSRFDLVCRLLLEKKKSN